MTVETVELMNRVNPFTTESTQANIEFQLATLRNVGMIFGS